MVYNVLKININSFPVLSFSEAVENLCNINIYYNIKFVDQDCISMSGLKLNLIISNNGDVILSKVS